MLLSYPRLTALVLLSISLVGAASPSDNVRHRPLPHRRRAPDSLPNDGGSWSKGSAMARQLVDQMTIEEKVNVTSGKPQKCAGGTGEVPRLGLRSLCFNDAGQGVRLTRNVSQFASQVTAAATWDVALIEQRAIDIAEEFVQKGVNVMLGPVSGPLGRSPLDGRLWETWSPDEYLSGTLSYTAVRAAQQHGIVTNAKHFLLNEQESGRSPYILNGVQPQPISSIVDDKTTHQLYAWPFAEAVRAGAGTVMCSYNRVNGTHACSNGELLNGLLKTEFNFQGAVISDWGGTWSTADSANNGLDVSMPGTGGTGFNGKFFNQELIDAVHAGQVSEARLTEMAMRILTPILEYQNLTALSLPTFNSFDSAGPTNNVQGNHADGIRAMGEASVTLLKNNLTAGLGLPLALNELKTLAIIGNDAGPNGDGPQSCGDLNMCFNFFDSGTVTIGGGSGSVTPPYIIDPLAAFTSYIKQHGGPKLNVALQKYFFYNAKTQAAASDAAIVFVSVFALEALDRSDLELNSFGADLIKTVADANKRTIVVIHAPGPVNMESWIDHPSIVAVLFAYYPGQESGTPLPSIVFGDVSPSGKLPFTIGKSISDYPPNGIDRTLSMAPEVNFTEGLFIDYKWFDKKNIEPRFEFGFGLSYSNFTYGSLSVKSTFQKDSTSIQPTAEKFKPTVGVQGASLYDVVLTAEALIKNTGGVAASEVVQLYVSFPHAPAEPVRVLRGFTKLALAAGESQTATFPLRRKDVAVWDVVSQQWIVQDSIEVSVASSSRKLASTVTWNF